MSKWSDFCKKNFKKMQKYDIKYDYVITSMKKIKEEIMNQKIDPLIGPCTIPKSKIEKLRKSFWVDPDLVYDYLDYDIHIKLGENNIYIKTSKDKFNKIKKRLKIFLNMISYISEKSKNKFNLYLILTYNKKYIDDSIICPKHVNSGYTDKSTNDIFIWREEEFEKVTFHELIHLIDHDHSHENIKTNVEINGPTSYFEAITDFKAIIYYIIYLSLVTNLRMRTLLRYEMFFIYNQAKYINNNLIKNNMKQKSPVYSYFILKYKIFYFMTHDDNNLFQEIFFDNKNYKKLIQLINEYNFDIESTFIDFNSAKMIFFELE
jgi:hypothetical protein